MVREFVHEDNLNWDKWLDSLLFAVQDVSSMGFSPFELLYGRKPQGVSDLLKENGEEGPKKWAKNGCN